MKKLLREGLLYALYTSLIHTALYQLNMYVIAGILRHPITYPYSLISIGIMTWFITSIIFARSYGQYEWHISTLQFMLVGLVNYLILGGIFLLYILNINQLHHSGLDVFGYVFMFLWNIFSGGSDDFVIAFITLLPTIIVFVIILGMITVVLNGVLYTFSKPLSDKLFDLFRFKKIKE